MNKNAMKPKSTSQDSAPNSEVRSYFRTYMSEYSVLLNSRINTRVLLSFFQKCLEVKEMRRKLIFVGNGASASIASHAATDFTQHAGVRCIALNDHNLITAFGNDYGYENWVAKALEFYSDEGDVVVLISSSGRSPNILNAARYCEKKNIELISLSGFDSDNPLKAASSTALWLDSKRYNVIETSHLLWTLQVIQAVKLKQVTHSFFLEQTRDFLAELLDESYFDDLIAVTRLFEETALKDGKVIFVGNGGAASLSSHAAVDLMKQGGIKTLSFNDHNLLTCYANDYGQVNWVTSALQAYANPGDAVILLSTSGESENLVNAASFGRVNGLNIVTITAMRNSNRLAELGSISIFLSPKSRHLIHSLQSAFLLAIVDYIAEQKISRR